MMENQTAGVTNMINTLLIIFTVCLCAQLWRAGGDGQSLYRNPGVPIVIALSKFILLLAIGLHFSVFLYALGLWAVLQGFSYGLNAPIHRFWVWLFRKGGEGNYRPVEITTRATCGFLWSLPAAIFAMTTNAWVPMIVYSIFLTVANGLIGGFVKDVEMSERLVGASVALAVIV